MAELASTSLFSDANLQEYYKLEDLTGKNGNTLTNNNSVTFVAAKYNNGASSGTTDADKTLNISSALGYGGGAYSVSCWIKILTEPSNTTQDIFYLTDGGTATGLHLDYTDTAGTKSINAGRVRWGVADDNGNATITALGTTTFHHIVYTYDGSNIRCYLDNSLIIGPTAASGNGSGAPTTMFILFGQSNSITANNGLMIIDDVGLFNRQLSAAEVTTLFTDATAGITGYRNLLGVGA